MPSVSFITDFIQLIAYFLRFNITYFITKMSLDTPMNVNKYPSDIYVRNTSTTNCIHCFLHFQYFRITFFFFNGLPLRCLGIHRLFTRYGQYWTSGFREDIDICLRNNIMFQANNFTSLVSKRTVFSTVGTVAIRSK